MATTLLVIQQASAALAPVANHLPRWFLAAALLLLFRPLMLGLLRAALLVLRPRLSRDEQQRRAHMRDLALVERMITASSSPSDAAELRAMAARG